MTMRPPWPPEIREAYERGERVGWSAVRGRWVSHGPYSTRESRIVRASRELQASERELMAKNKDTSGETRRAVAAALEALRPSALSQKRPSVPERCPRCGGSIIAATEAGGERDDHCLACSFRPAALTPEQARAEVARFEVPGKSRRRQPASRGVRL